MITEKLKKLILEDEAFCIALASYKEPLDATLYQIQLSMVTEENKDSVGAVVLALSKIHETFNLMITHGEALIAERKKKEPK